MNQCLLKAAEDGDLSTVRKLLKKLPLVNVNIADDVTHLSALSKACHGNITNVHALR